MNELKKLYNFIKKLWNNKRTRAGAILLIYSIFILILIAAIRLNSDEINKNLNSNSYNENETEEITSNKEENKMLKYLDNYNYNMEIILENKQKYKIENKKNEINYYIFNTNLNNYDIIDTFPENIINIDLNYILYLINNNDEEFYTHYKDGTILKNYIVNYNNEETIINVRFDNQDYIKILDIKINNIKYNIIFSV